VQPSTPPTSAALPAGTLVGEAYRIVRPLAEGGMGTVYEVLQVTTGARRALKVMHGHFAHDEGLRARFAREARLAASIPSDHVAQVLDAGLDEANDVLYIVMELLEGTTLSREARRRGAFAWPDVLEIMRQLAHALGAAHDLAIVHRDLKPANIFLSPSRNASGAVTVKVLDFGIAKAVAASSESTGALLGTPSWMAPEQTISDVPIGPQADVWALGLLAYLLLTGKHYFPSANLANATPAVMLRELVIDPIGPASERAGRVDRRDRLPHGFDAWFARCLDREPSNRFADARAAYQALALLPAPSPEPPVPTFAEDPPASPSPASLAGVDAVATAVAAPQASRASRGSRGTPQAHSAPTLGAPTAPPASRGRRVVLLGAAAALGAAAIGGLLLSSRHPAPIAAIADAEVAAAAPVAPVLRLHGSNTIGSELGPALAEAFLKRRTGASVVRRRVGEDAVSVEAREGDKLLEAIEVEGHGTATAFADLAANRCDVGMASRRIHEDEAARDASVGDLRSAASEHVVGLDGIAVVVNPTNAVSTLTRAQLEAIFTGAVRSWAEVGGADGPVAIYARDERSGTFDTFGHLVLRERALGGDARRFESSEALSDAVAADPRAIGFIGLPYIRNAKPVMIQTSAAAAALLPSPVTVATEDYALARRLYLYTPAGGSVVGREFVDFALSDQGQAIVEAAGFVDLRPECDRGAPRCATCAASYLEAVRGACRLSVNFRFDHGQLDTRALRDLQRIATFARRPENAGRSLLLLGLAESAGSREEDLATSQRSAETVAAQLRARGLRVDLARGFGRAALAADAGAPAAQDVRRVEVWLR